MSQQFPDKNAVMEIIRESLHAIAPEVDFSSLRPDVSLRDQVELDSMDYLNLMIGIHNKLGVDIPETDYAKLNTLDAAAQYLLEKLQAAEPAQLKRTARR